MARITIELEVGDALIAMGAIDRQSASAHRERRRLVGAGSLRAPELEIADTTAAACDRVAASLAEAIYGPEVSEPDPAWPYHAVVS